MAFRDTLNRQLRRIPCATIYIVSAIYAAWLFWRGVSGDLGANPVEALEHAYGEAALYMLIAGLAITPLCRHLKINMMKFRRSIGLACFFFLMAHVLVWAVLDVQSLGRIWADIIKRPYITVGMASFVLMLPLAITSNNLSIRKMGAAWRKLHKLVYPAAVLGALHYVMLVKGWQAKPMVMMGIICLLLLLRLPIKLRAPKVRAATMVRSQS